MVIFVFDNQCYNVTWYVVMGMVVYSCILTIILIEYDDIDLKFVMDNDIIDVAPI